VDSFTYRNRTRYEMYRGNGKTADDTAESATTGKNREVSGLKTQYFDVRFTALFNSLYVS